MQNIAQNKIKQKRTEKNHLDLYQIEVHISTKTTLKSARIYQKLVTGYQFETKNCFIQAKLTQLVSKKARGQ